MRRGLWVLCAVVMLAAARLCGQDSLRVVSPPVEADSGFSPSDLVEVVRLDSSFRIDVRYATSGNFMKRPMYSQARVFLQRPAARALVHAQQKLTSMGYGLLLFDGYRPWSVTKKFWDETPPEKRKFVADPHKGSKHNRGCAIDLTLYDLATGKEMEMPSPYDDFTDCASPSYAGGTPEQRKRRDLLRHVMESEGFRVEPTEWWHFDYREWRVYRIENVPFEKLDTTLLQHSR
jgi:D-alanyl-D-alanine dipeptidase